MRPKLAKWPACTVVTGSGPHAGDASARRIEIKPETISQLHADLVMLLVGLAVALAVAVTALGAAPAVRVTTRLLVAALAVQAAIGFAQYFDKLPIGLVELHMIGAAGIALTLGRGLPRRSCTIVRRSAMSLFLFFVANKRNFHTVGS